MARGKAQRLSNPTHPPIPALSSLMQAGQREGRGVVIWGHMGWVNFSGDGG